MWWLQNIFKYSWKVIVLFITAWFFLFLAFSVGFSNWTDESFQVNDLYLLGCVIGVIVFYLFTRRQAIKEFDEKHPPEQ